MSDPTTGFGRAAAVYFYIQRHGSVSGVSAMSFGSANHQHRVLVIEDDDAIRELLRECLDDASYHAIPSDHLLDPSDVLQLRPDLIVLDLVIAGKECRLGLRPGVEIALVNGPAPDFGMQRRLSLCRSLGCGTSRECRGDADQADRYTAFPG